MHHHRLIEQHEQVFQVLSAARGGGTQHHSGIPQVLAANGALDDHTVVTEAFITEPDLGRRLAPRVH